MFCILKSCRKCSGDLVLDGDELRCWQCGRYYYPNPPLVEPLQGAQELGSASEEGWLGEVTWRRHRRRIRRAVRHINSLIGATDRSDQRWWDRNREVIGYLDEGRPVREISQMVGRGERQIRVVRERLNDLRSCRGYESTA